MNEHHEPSPEFVDRLEWQIRRELRRQDRFEIPATAWWRRRALRTAALVVVSVALGWAGATAAQDVTERRQMELLRLQTFSRMELAELQYEFASERLGEIERRVAVGAASEEELGRARFERAFTERDFQTAQLDLEELEATGHPPRDDLDAPRVNGRDLVSERIQLRLESMQDQLTHLASEVERFERGVRIGTVDPIEVDYRRMEMEHAQRSVTLLRRTLELRSQALSGELTAEQAEARRERLHARLDAESQRAQATNARSRADRIVGRPDAGELERTAAEYEARMAEIRAEMAELRLEALRKEGGEE